MAVLEWDKVGERKYETGVDRGVLYIPTAAGAYDNGYAWNGLTAVTESPSGAEPTPMYADNQKYLNLISLEEFGGTIEAFTYPDEFMQCDGTATPVDGVNLGQQNRKSFGLSYRSRVGNDLLATDFGYKLHMVYGALAMPSEKAFNTINDSPEAIPFSWEFSTTPVAVPGFKASAILTLESWKVPAARLTDLENFLYGTAGTNPRLPLPSEVISLIQSGVVDATPAAPTYNSTTDLITIPSTTGVVYKVNGVVVPAGNFGPITKNTVVEAFPAVGYKFPAAGVQDEWFFTFA